MTVLEALAAERQRSEALSRRVSDALRYPAFLLFAAGAVLLFFLNFVLPQFANVFRDFDAKLDPVLATFLRLSDFMRSNGQTIAAAALISVLAVWVILRRRSTRGPVVRALARLPIVRPIMDYHRTGLFCRNLSLMLSSGVMLTSALRILVDTMESTGTAHNGRISSIKFVTAESSRTRLRQHALSRRWRFERSVWEKSPASWRCLRGALPISTRRNSSEASTAQSGS